MEILLLVFCLLIGGGGVYLWQEHRRDRIEQQFVLVPRSSLGERLEISTGSGELMCSHCNGLLQETVEAALLISTKHPNQAEIKVYRHHASKHPYAERVGLGAVYVYQDFIFPFVVPSTTRQEIEDWVFASKIISSHVGWIDNHTLRVWDPLADFRTGQAADYPEENRLLDQERMAAGLRRILRIADLKLYDPKAEDIPLSAPISTVELPIA